MAEVAKYAVKYDMLPSHMQEAAARYVEMHERPGDFLQAVLRNDLVGAFARADAENVAAMPVWADWLYNECPSKAWGSKEAVDAWVEDAS